MDADGRRRRRRRQDRPRARRAAAVRPAAARDQGQPRRQRRALRPVAPRARRLRDPRPRQRRGQGVGAVVLVAARLRGPHDGARLEVPVPHHPGGGAPPHAHRAGAAALHRERVQPAGDVGGQGLGHVAVRVGHRQGLRPQAEHLPRRPPRRARVDARRARLPAAPARHVRRLAPRAGRLQLRPGHRAARDQPQPEGRPAHRLREPEPAGGDAPVRAQAAGGQEHRDAPGRLLR